jgi:citrate lyase subunit beta/citryl-CoA lyase
LFGADCLVLDLEDSVASDRKAEARILLRRTLELHRGFFEGTEVIVRINPLSGGRGRDDIAELARCLPDAILLPKCEDPGSVAELAALLDGFEAASGTEPGRTLILPLVETARGVLAAASIATASPRVAALCFGAEDFTRDIGARRTAAGSETAYARAAIVVAARAAGVQALDSVYADTEDATGFAAYCAASRSMGFDGVGLVHPRQVATAHTAFTPDQSEVDEARRVVAALEEAEAHGLGVASQGGRMVDAPVAERARRIVAMAGFDDGGIIGNTGKES